MLETAAFAASLAECEVESEVRPSFPGYRFRESDAPVVLAATALREAGSSRAMRSRVAVRTPTSSTHAASRA